MNSIICVYYVQMHDSHTHTHTHTQGKGGGVGVVVVVVVVPSVWWWWCDRVSEAVSLLITVVVNGGVEGPRSPWRTTP